MRRLTVLSFVGLMCAQPAAAHWEHTRWEMPRAEVLKLYPGARAFTDESGWKWLEASKVTVAGRTYPKVGFKFRDGALHEVRLEMAEDLPAVQAELRRRYGDPVSESYWDTFGSAGYNDVANGDRIRLSWDRGKPVQVFIGPGQWLTRRQ